MKEQINYRSIKYNWHEAELTLLEGVLARGDRKVGKILYDVYKKGAMFDSWSEYFKYDAWMETFKEMIWILYSTLQENVIRKNYSLGTSSMLV